MPTLIFDLRCTESRAISRYIAAKNPDKSSTLYPSTKDLRANARFEEAASLELADFDEPVHTLIFEKSIKQ